MIESKGDLEHVVKPIQYLTVLLLYMCMYTCKCTHENRNTKVKSIGF